MTTYSRVIRSSATGSGVAAVELIAGARECRLLELGINIVNATASQFVLGRPAAKGITPTTPMGLLSQYNLGAASLAQLAVAWGTGPTLPAAFFRQTTLPATAGAGLVPNWTFSNGGIQIPAAGSIVIWTLSAVSIADFTFTISE